MKIIQELSEIISAMHARELNTTDLTVRAELQRVRLDLERSLKKLAGLQL